MIVRIPAPLVQAVRDHAVASYPDECCGLLAGRADDASTDITEARKSRNVTEGDPGHGFEVDPKLRFDMMRTLETANDGRMIVGHYHSHPDQPAAPSVTDLSMAYEPAFIWVICAVDAEGNTEVAAFRPNADVTGFDRLDLIET